MKHTQPINLHLIVHLIYSFLYSLLELGKKKKKLEEFLKM